MREDDSITVNVTTTAIHHHAYESVDGTSRIKCSKCGDETTIEALLPLGMLPVTAADILRGAPLPGLARARHTDERTTTLDGARGEKEA